MSSQMVPQEKVMEATSSEILDRRKVSLEEYFALEQTSRVRLEYVDGKIRAMAGETPNHNIIAGNIYVRLRIAMAERHCQSFIENIRVRVMPTRYRYPDVTAVCGEAQFDTENPPTLLNPGLVIEVLSLSTTEIDFGEKFNEYRRLVTLQDYLLVAQDQVEVTHYARKSEHQWLVSIYTHLEDSLTLASVELHLSLADIYRQIIFTSPTPATSQE